MITVERIQTFQLQCPWSQRDHAKRANHFKSMPGLCCARYRFNYNWKWTPATLCWVWRSWRSRFDVVGFQLQRCVLAPVAPSGPRAPRRGLRTIDGWGWMCALRTVEDKSCALRALGSISYNGFNKSNKCALRAHSWQCRLKETAQGYKRWGARSAPAWS